MNFELKIKRSAQKALAKIEAQQRKQIIESMRKLSTNPRPAGCKKLSGRDAWRIRVGNYRVIYEIHDNELLILVVVIGHRKRVTTQLTPLICASSALEVLIYRCKLRASALI